MPIIDYTRLNEPELLSASVHIQRLMNIFHRSDRDGAYQIFRVEHEAIAEEINLRRQADQPTEQMPAVQTLRNG